ncbi:uncharacterized protein LOC121972070 isoform X1 [Zingiber officinale]|uniref:uncharacterized protein LOC121972070 isoform X1 n=1 Tax=Zingiber officinale TaxID=94328 RepID=UPI001C4D6179|nr:uncharacterized protein LOC121972070 isoform X1 [Zingiber officinale]
MPGIQGTTSPGHFLSFDDDDGGFGDFKVASVNHPFPSRPQQDDDDDDWGDFMVSPMGSNGPVGSPSPPPSIFDAFPSDPAPGDKMPSKGAKLWEKPRGALPLSIFGEEEADEPQTIEPPVIFSPSFSSSGPAKDRKGVVVGGELKDLITSLYGQAPQPEGGQKTGSSLGEAKEEDSDESSWEFKEASSSPNSTLKEDEKFGFDTTAALDFGNVEEANGQTGVDSNGGESTKFSDKNVNVQHKISNSKNGVHWFFSNEAWEFNNGFPESTATITSEQQNGEKLQIKNAQLKVLESTNAIKANGSIWEAVDQPIQSYTNFKKETYERPLSHQDEFSFELDIVANTTKDTISVPIHEVNKNTHDMFIDVGNDKTVFATEATENESEIYQRNPDEFTFNSVVDFYCRLKDESISLLNCHLDDMKKSYDVASLSGDRVKAAEINEEIKEVYKKLEEAKGSGNASVGKQRSMEQCVSQLLKALEELNLQAFEQEYHLSERIISAGKNLSAAIKFLEHTSSVLHSLLLASLEEQKAYIHAWSDMAAACVEELLHGATIWQESVQSQAFAQILSQESNYFIALGEIHRVAEVLGASLKVYKPWLLLNQGNYSSKLLASLDKCAEAWTLYGLEEAVKTISESHNVEHARLAKTLLASIKIIHELDLSRHSFSEGKKICRISLLSTEELKDLKMEQWHEKCYFVKLANLWANRVCYEPPQLPYLHVS